MLALKLANAGWWGGDPDAVERAPVDSVLEAADFVNAMSDYDTTYIHLNREER